MNDSASLGPALLIAGGILLLGARYTVRSAMPPRRGRHRRRPGSPKPRPQAVPAPITGGATGLLESIPFLEPARPRRRMRGAGRLVLGIAGSAAVVAALLFLFARQLTAWLDGAGL